MQEILSDRTMKTFKEFLLEEDDIPSLVDFIKKNCQPYLKLVGVNSDNLSDIMGGSKTLYRGINLSENEKFIDKDAGVLEKITRKDRKAKDMLPELSDLVSAEFINAFGWDARREGIFCTGDIHLASEYGALRIIIPCGKVEYLWSSENKDLYILLGKYLRLNLDLQAGAGKSNIQLKMLISNNTNPEALKKLKNKIRKTVSEYKKTDIINAIKSNNEISIKCDKYLAIPIRYSITN